MSILSNFFGGIRVNKKAVPVKSPTPAPRAEWEGTVTYRNVFTVSYDGEKSLGEMGPVKRYVPDYTSLRLRSWQAYLESEIAQTIINKYALWVIGSGLKLQAEPLKKVLDSEGIKIKTEDFNEIVEARFTAYVKSKASDYAGMRSIQKIANRAFVNAIIGGDVLVILRYIDGFVKVQLIDGAHVDSPVYGDPLISAAEKKGNTIKNGVELSPTGEHVAFYVKDGMLKRTRVEAKNSLDLTCAFLIYGLEYRLDTHRGLPLIAGVLETMKKLERYKEAAVGSAEERQKIPYFFTHEAYSTGENPLAKSLAKSFNAGGSDENNVPVDDRGKQLADTVAATTKKSVFNMPNGADVKSMESKSELQFAEFYTVNRDSMCATIGIPPDVAMSMYNNSFSASRAATKDWEHTLSVKRDDFSFLFYQSIYNFWLESEILKNKVQAPGYLKAKIEKNELVMSAYRNARFVGANFPHIDPLKEVNAERAKLGKAGVNIPLTTVEAATEALNGGDSDQNMAQFAEELKESIRLEIQAQ